MAKTELGDAGRVYRCEWRKVAKGYEVRTVGRKVYAGEGETFEQARDAVLDAIMASTGDGEAYLDIESPPAPPNLAPFFRKMAYWVWGEGGAVPANLPDLYDGGICFERGHPVGRRNGTTAVLKSVSRNCAGAIAGVLGPVFAEKFVQALPGTVPKSIFRAVEVPRGKEPFFELDVTDAIEPAVVDLSLGTPGIECKKCGYRSVSYALDGDRTWFVDERLLSRPFVIVGHKGRKAYLVLRADVWRHVAARKLNKICSREMPVAPSGLVVANPALPKR